MSASETSIWFEENIGQTDPRVRFLARTRQATVFVTDLETVYSLRGDGDKKAAVRMTLDGEQSGHWSSEEPKPLIVSSFVGGEEHWRERISTFGRLRRAGIYPGVDLVYYGKGREIEYDFELRRGSEAGRIRMRFDGAREVRIGTSGDLEIATAAGVLVHRRPVVFQGGKSVEARYVAHEDGAFGVALGLHDPARPLTIDPVVNFARFYGGDGEDVITGMSGSSVAGYTNSTVFPGSTQPAAGGYDAFFATYGQEQRVTYVGGSGDDKALAVSSYTSGTGLAEYAIVGQTNSRDFPVMRRRLSEFSNTQPPLFAPPQSKYGGGDSDGFYFWSAPNSPESTLVSSYLGGAGTDRALGVYVADGTIAVVGETDSPDFPRSAGSPQGGPAGGVDGFYFRQSSPASFNSAWTSTLFGGTGDDRLTHLSSLEVASGVTSSDDLPVVKAFQAQRGGGTDGMVVQFSPTGIAPLPVFASYLGGSADDEIAAIRFTSWGGVAVGTTSSPDFPGGSSEQFGGGKDGFVCEIALPSAYRTEAIVRTKFIGGSGDDSIRAAWPSGTGQPSWPGYVAEIFFTGTTTSSDLPVREPLQATYGGGPSDLLVGLYSREGDVPFLSYYGGPGREEGVGGGAGADELPLLAGNTDSGELPGADASRFAGGTDGFLISFQLPVLMVTGRLAVNGGVLGATIAPAVLPEGRPVRLRIRSADPGRLLLAYTGSHQGREELEATWDGRSYSFVYWGLSDSGTVDVVVSADGFAERHVPVVLTAPVFGLIASTSGGLTDSYGNLHALASTARDALLTLRLTASASYPDSAVPIVVDYPRAGLPAPRISVASSSPEVVRMQANAPGLLVNQNRGWEGNLLSPGESTLTMRIEGDGGVYEARPVQVRFDAPALTMAVGSLAEQWLTVGQASIGRLAGPKKITITSLDPDAALLAINRGDVPRPSISAMLPATGNGVTFYVVGGRRGATARLRMSAQGFADFDVERLVGTSHYQLPLGPQTVEVGGTLSLSVAFGVPSATVSTTFGNGAASGKPFQLRLASSDPSIVEVVQESLEIPAGESQVSFSVRGAAPGTAVLELQGDERLTGVADRVRMAVTVIPAESTGVLVPRLTVVGKDLQRGYAVRVPGQEPTQVSMSSGDPSKLLISTDSNETGKDSATVNNTSATLFYLQALEADGIVPVTVRAGDITETMDVQLAPSFAAVTPANEASVGIMSGLDLSVGYYARQPGVWSAVLAGPSRNNQVWLGTDSVGILRPGVEPPEIRMESDDPDVGQVEGSSPASRTGARFRFQSKAAGTARVQVSVSGSMELDPRSRSVRVVARPFEITTNWSRRYLLKDSITLLRPSTTAAAISGAPPILAQTGDPSNALLSELMGNPPAESIKLGNAGGYIWGMKESGTGSIRLSHPMAGERVLEFELAPSALTYSNLSARTVDVGMAWPREPLEGTVGKEAATLAFGLTDAEGRSGDFVSLQPNAGGRPKLEVSPPGALELSATEIIAGRSFPVQVKALREGDAMVRVTPMDGYPIVAGAREIPFRIQLPKIPGVPSLISLMKDMQERWMLNAAVSGVTVTSSDPSVFLVAPALPVSPFGPAHTGQPSVTLSDAGASYFLLPVREGTARLELKSTGFQTETVEVRVGPLLLEPEAPERVALGETGAKIRIRASQVPGGTYRIGATPFTVRVESDRPDILAVDPAAVEGPTGELTLQPLREGTATLRVTAPDGVAIAPREMKVEVYLPRSN
ncbi:MAG TPA: hypothetical protein VFQ91_13635 [Bryobacteraceae bacterium]|nr:hypothetical protein [Bryobacteraceae bacterium]